MPFRSVHGGGPTAVPIYLAEPCRQLADLVRYAPNRPVQDGSGIHNFISIKGKVNLHPMCCQNSVFEYAASEILELVLLWDFHLHL